MTGNKTNINFLSAGDRVNYGDFLFPIISLRKFNNKKFNFFNYGLVKSDFSHFEALPTNSYKRLQKELYKSHDEILIIGGGEIFFPTWTLLYSYINETFFRLLKFYYFKKLEKKFNLSKYLLSNGQVNFPFSPNKNDFKARNLKIIYNSVGGVFQPHMTGKVKKALIANLKTAEYISVRDFDTLNSLKKEGINSFLTPDSALIMSDFFNKDFLHKKNKRLQKYFNEKYLFLQLAEYCSPTNIDKFLAELKLISKKLNLKIILCPIGLASGHNDQIILKKIAKKATGIIYIQPLNIFEIMGLIANSQLYLGTSLHGAITAQSFNVPFLPIKKDIRKLSSFYSTWHPVLPIFDIDVNSLERVPEYFINWKHKEIIENTINQKRIVYDNYKRMNSIINY